MDETERRDIIIRAKEEGATTLDLSGKGLTCVPRELAPANYEARQWGPLRRIHMPDNTHRWLCPEHAAQRRR